MRPALLLLALVTLIRLPFLNQAIQGDDPYYLAPAEHAQIEPLHPKHTLYVFQGNQVDLRGFSHPPLNDWFLAAVLAILGDIREVPFHAAYLVFSWISVLAMWSLAQRFSPRPFLAVLLFLTVPVFVVNGTFLESDLPFLAFWLAATALWVKAVDSGSLALLIASMAAMIPAALAAYQSVVLVPILAFYLWQHRRTWRIAWLAVLTPGLALLGWQIFELATSGAMPVQVLLHYSREYQFQSHANKLKSAAALIAHLGWITGPLLLIGSGPQAVTALAFAGGAFLDWNPLFWISFSFGLTVFVQAVRRAWFAEPGESFLSAWLAVFVASALTIFFAGSARYLLPAAAPLVLLTVNRLQTRTRLLIAGALLNLALGLALATVNYQHWDGYRRFVASIGQQLRERRVWINGEWGLRFYAEAEGGIPLVRGQAVRPGDIVLSSKLAMPVTFTTGGGMATPMAEETIRASLPFRLIGLDSRSAYSSADRGFRPFDIAANPIDIVRADLVVERKPALAFLPMNAPGAESQIVSGLHQLEEGAWRWAAARAVVLLKRPDRPMPLVARFGIPGTAPGRLVKLTLDGAVIAEQRYERPDSYTLRTAPLLPREESATVTLEIDKSFRVPGDQRDLGFVLVEIGFQEK